MDKLKEYLDRTVPQFWAEKKEPFLLSVIGSSFNKEQIRAETDGLGVADWIRKNPDLGYKIISDPSNRARIGMIPANEDFTYSKNKIRNNQTENSFSDSDRETTLKFLELLKQRCTHRELQEVNIPISILMKIL